MSEESMAALGFALMSQGRFELNAEQAAVAYTAFCKIIKGDTSE